MRRISTPILLAVLLAAFAVAPAVGSAAAAHQSHRTHHKQMQHRTKARHRKTAAARARAHKKVHRAAHHEARQRRAVAHVVPRARRLKVAIASHPRCLASLDAQSRKLVALRTGANGPMHTQAAVARTLHVTLRRERLLEQISVFELRGSVPGVCTSTHTARTLTPSASLTATPPWLHPGSV